MASLSWAQVTGTAALHSSRSNSQLSLSVAAVSRCTGCKRKIEGIADTVHCGDIQENSGWTPAFTQQNGTLLALQPSQPSASPGTNGRSSRSTT